MPFDVEPTMPPGSGTDPDVARAIKSVNLMCYLLGDLTYNQLYRDPFQFALQSILARALALQRLPYPGKLREGAYTTTDISASLITCIQNIARIPSIDNITLGSLFLRQFANGTPEHSLIVELDALYSDSLNSQNQCELTHFCCPFRYYQEGASGLQPAVLDEFLRQVGEKTMYNLFTEPKSSYSPDQRTILGHARTRDFILWDISSRPGVPSAVLDAERADENGFGILTRPLGNGLRCDNGVCTNQGATATDWCNDANGSCSGASTP